MAYFSPFSWVITTGILPLLHQAVKVIDDHLTLDRAIDAPPAEGYTNRRDKIRDW
jgi:hypothetical protein